MTRLLIFSLALLLLTVPAYSDTPPDPRDEAHATLFHSKRPETALLRSVTPRGPGHITPVALSCCKVCSVGKACGNTCISRNKTCHVGPGCACDG